MLSNRLWELRKEHSISQEALADELGVTRQTINAIENNRVIPTLHLAFKIADFFDMQIEDVFLRVD